MAHNSIFTRAQLTTEEIAKLKQNDFEVKREDGGYLIIPRNKDFLPKTVTGFYNVHTGEFVSVLLVPTSEEKPNRIEKLVFWKEED